MPLLAVAKRRAGQALGDRTLVADSAETAFCAATSAKPARTWSALLYRTLPSG